MFWQPRQIIATLDLSHDCTHLEWMMAKVVQKSLKSANAGARPDSVTAKRVAGGEGKSFTVYTVDAGSKSFGEDLSYAFRQNVKRARKENKRLVGSADGVPAKGR